ncbi:MAG: nucleoside deaminase [Salinivirgaceae bacterium]|jgi:guanine deaminase|nr:nucleoside deaminase [Salinivirgaceae bacterium]
MKEIHEKFMREAINLSQQNIERGGGPFAAVIVKNGELISASANTVTDDNDPTAHAEVNAIRTACKKLKTYDLSDCTIYTSCEPCPMCLGAIYWARIAKVYYGNTKSDAQNIGFDDSFIYEELELAINKRKVKFIQLLPTEAIKTFQKWDDLDDKIEY